MQKRVQDVLQQPTSQVEFLVKYKNKVYLAESLLKIPHFSEWQELINTCSFEFIPSQDKDTNMNTPTIIPYAPEYQPDFKRLNIEWISRYFTVEPHDLEQLDHPEIYILPNNGQIFFARIDADLVGCVALINMQETGFELAKMAVAPDAQGKGIGKQLCLAAIDYAREQGVKTLWLESNRKLTPALTMYSRVGFLEVPSIPTPYTRADIRMEMTL